MIVKKAEGLLRKLRSRAFGFPPVAAALRTLAASRVVPKRIWLRLKFEAEFEVSVPKGGAFLYRTSERDGIGQTLLWDGLEGFEAETMHLLLELSKAARTFVDVGANTGIYTLAASSANPNLRCFAFEPVPSLRERLRTNLSLNGLEGRCEDRGEALSNEEGVAELFVPALEVPTMASLKAGGYRPKDGQLIEVPVITLDDFLAEEDRGPVDLVKIDVESFEDRVLAGMTRILLQDRPALIVECNPDGPFEAVEASVTTAGYRLFHLVSDGPKAVAKIVPDPDERYRNFLCVHPDGFGTTLVSEYASEA